MTRSEWIEVVQRMRVNWPHSAIPDQSIAKWYDDLAHLPAEQVAVGVEALYREGREYPPNGAQVIAKVAELDRADVDHGAAWNMVRKALWKHVPHWGSFYADLHEQSPAACEAARRYGFEAQSGYLVAEEGTVRAQFREIYRNVVAEHRRDDAYAGLPDVGLRSLEKRPRRAGEAVGRALKLIGGGA